MPMFGLVCTLYKSSQPVQRAGYVCVSLRAMWPAAVVHSSARIVTVSSAIERVA